MQFVKEEIKQRIVAAARREFLRLGFENASIRGIAAQAQTSKSNIYNYFKDKDALFCAVVEPTLSGLQKGLQTLKRQNAARSINSYTMEAQKHYIDLVMNFVFDNIEDFRLLFFYAGGSSLEGFKSQVTDDSADVLIDWYAHVRPEKPVSRFFIQCIVGFYISTLEQILLLGVSGQQVGEHPSEFLKFVYGGWRSVMS